MKFLLLLLTCLSCSPSCFVYAQDTKDKETIKINGTADTLLTPNFCDCYIMKVMSNVERPTIDGLSYHIKRLLSGHGVDTSKVMLTSVINNDMAVDKKDHNFNIVINLRTFEFANIGNIKSTLGDDGYRVYRCNVVLSDSLIDKETISRVLLARAIRNGRIKANDVAKELGMRSIKFVSFNEGELIEGKSESSRYGADAEETGKIKLTKQVVLVYRPTDDKK